MSKSVIFTCILLFFSVSFLLGQSFQQVNPSSIGITHTNSPGRNIVSGVAFCDINNDFHEDLVFGSDTDLEIYTNNGDGTFTDIGILAGVKPTQSTNTGGLVSGDLNNDGFVDLVFYSRDRPAKLFINNGNETFDEISDDAGINIYQGVYNDSIKVFSVALGDINLDGWLDMYVTTWRGQQTRIRDANGNVVGWDPECPDDRLYINNGDLTFTEMSGSYGLGGDGCGLAGVLSDPDNDGDLDILITNDFGPWHTPDRVFKNNYPSPTFTEVSASLGFDQAIYGMGLGVGDYDKDLDLDYYKTTFGQKVLLNNNGNGFDDVTLAAGVDDTYSATNPSEIKTGWGAGFTDCDNDSHLDILVANGKINFDDYVDVELYQPSALFYNQGNGTFVDQAIQEGVIDTFFSRGIAYGDLNNDGSQDLIFVRGGFRDRQGVVYPADTAPGVFMNTPNGNNWLKIKLQGVVNNRDAIGTHINIHSSAGSWLHEINSGAQGHASQNSRIAHFGLGTATVVDSIVIQWPGNATPDQVFYNIDVNQLIHIKELDTNINTVTCYNGIKDGDETDADCGGSICNVCDCNKEIKIFDYPKDFDIDNTFRYEDHLIIRDDAVFNVSAEVKALAGNYIEIQKGEILSPSNGSLTLDIEQCLLKDLCYYTSLCDLEHFDIDNFDQYSIARIWMEVLLESIRNDFARPTMHARNLHHAAALMYDIWLIYHTNSNPNASNYLADQTLHGFTCPMNLSGIILNAADVDEAISHAMATFLRHRFANSPSISVTTQNIFGLFDHFGYDVGYTGNNFNTANPADIGNYVAQCYIDFGLQDGANETNDFTNQFYTPVNDPLVTNYPGNPDILDPNRWQPLTLEVFIDQSGNVIPQNTPDFLSPEWGEVSPFAMTPANMTTLSRDGNNFNVYHDPSAPPYLDPINNPAMSDEYKWGFMMVAVWGAHLDHNDPTTIDISPAAIGNNNTPWPSNYYNLPSYYNFFNGNDYGTGHASNPITGQTYTPQIVKRGDYARVLAEFWADGPDSETPPGHWFTILNYVSDHPSFQKRFEGTGPVLDDLQWDVLSYFTLGGTMHDAAIAAWSVKGYYDYLRPISAIRYMADQGQSSNPGLPNYDPNGVTLIPGYCELVNAGDPLVGTNNEHLNKIKLFTWKGPDYINNPDTDAAGVGWILAENWWPYQRPSFVTPPFAGYVSGHSTFSRAAAEVMTNMTGSAFFPDGLGEFHAPKNEFLVFEEGPSQDIILQWATYRDASDQCSLSRIWGGIHPPVDDIPGRVMGEQIGIDAFNFSKNLLGY